MPSDASRPVLTRESYQAASHELERRFLAQGEVGPYLAGRSALIDRMMSGLYAAAVPAGRVPATFAVLALGGYGRREMFPYSDIDVVFLTGPHGSKARAQTTPIIEAMLYGGWDRGLTLGHAVFTRAEALRRAEEDMVFRTSLLDARFLLGRASLAEDVLRRFRALTKARPLAEFVTNKLQERDRRHVRWNDSRYVLEPHIKDGKGGLRDIHLLYWLADYVYGEATPTRWLTAPEQEELAAQHVFLQRVRIHLHLAAKRAEERLTFDRQTQIAPLLGFYDDGAQRAVEHFMKQYFRATRLVGQVMRSFCAALEDDHKVMPRRRAQARLAGETILGDFRLDGGRLTVASESAFEEEPKRLITLFTLAHEYGLDIHPRSLALATQSLARIDGALRRDAKANEAFLALLLSSSNPEPTLKRMNDTGVLGHFIPDFGKIVGQMQFDMYHVFTVDEHIIFAIGILHGIGAGKYRESMPIASDVFPLLAAKRVVFLALLAHDIAKGRGGDHSLLGEVVVRKLARRFGLDRYETEDCAWLVRHHLLMSHTAFKRDPHDPRTVQDFVNNVQSLERLRQLLVLTVADIRAVGPNVWNGWKGALLRELYYEAEARMGAPSLHLKLPSTLPDALADMLPGWSKDAIAAYLALGDVGFQRAFTPERHASLAQFLREREKSGEAVLIATEDDAFHAITELWLAAPEQKSLFAHVAGAIALAGASIVGAKIVTLKNAVTAQLFQMQATDGASCLPPAQRDRLRHLLEQTLSGKLDIEAALSRPPSYPRRADAIAVPLRVLIENNASAQHTVIEISGRDQPGFLYRVTSLLAAKGYSVVTAHISTYGERAVDVFYIKDRFGMKLQHLGQIRQLQQALTQAAGPALGAATLRL